jgi:hypothetical protein
MKTMALMEFIGFHRKLLIGISSRSAVASSLRVGAANRGPAVPAHEIALQCHLIAMKRRGLDAERTAAAECDHYEASA